MRRAGFAVQLLSPRIVIPLIICCFASTLAYGSVASTYSLDAECSIFFSQCGTDFPPPPPPQDLTSYAGGGFFFTGSTDLPGVVGVYPVSFSFSGPVTGFSEQIFNCDQYNNCQYMWQGNIPSGVISLSATLQYANYTTRTLTFTGTFTGGYFSGAYTDVCFENEGGPCFSEWQGVNFFSGTWSNGWKSTGGSFWEEMDSEPNWIGLIGMPISTPEPTSIALLGSGVLGLIGYWRKRLRM